MSGSGPVGGRVSGAGWYGGGWEVARGRTIRADEGIRGRGSLRGEEVRWENEDLEMYAGAI